MAVKTITIDMEAYRVLDAEKREGESFSKVIKRKLGDAPKAVDLLRAIDRIVVDEAVLDGVEAVVRRRSEQVLKPIDWDKE